MDIFIKATLTESVETFDFIATKATLWYRSHECNVYVDRSACPTLTTGKRDQIRHAALVAVQAAGKHCAFLQDVSKRHIPHRSNKSLREAQDATKPMFPLTVEDIPF